MTERTKDVLFLFVVTALAFVVALLCVACVDARADYTVAFGAKWCGPCQRMKPIEAAERAAGQDIREVDIDEQPAMKAAYRVGRIPCFVRVAETPWGNYEVGRITGVCTAGQLRRLSIAPGVVTVGAAARSAVRFVIGSPTPLFPEW